MINPRFQEINQARQDIAIYRERLDTAEKLKASREQLIAAYNSIQKSDLDSLKALLPDTVDNIEVELTKGLVYAVIKFKKSIFNSMIFQVENDMISQERIPLASFLKQTEKELSTYK